MPHPHVPAAPPLAAGLMAACLLATSAAAQTAAPPQQQAALPSDAATAAPAPAAPAPAAPAAAVAQVVPLRSLLSQAVVDPTDTVVAVVQDFVLDPATGRVHAVLAVSGRNRLVAVPTPALRLREDGSLLVNADRRALLAMPAIDAPALADASGAEGGPLLAPTRPRSPRPVPLTPLR